MSQRSFQILYLPYQLCLCWGGGGVWSAKNHSAEILQSFIEPCNDPSSLCVCCRVQALILVMRSFCTLSVRHRRNINFSALCATLFCRLAPLQVIGPNRGMIYNGQSVTQCLQCLQQWHIYVLMQVYIQAAKKILRAQDSWPREITFSEILQNVPKPKFPSINCLILLLILDLYSKRKLFFSGSRRHLKSIENFSVSNNFWPMRKSVKSNI